VAAGNRRADPFRWTNGFSPPRASPEASTGGFGIRYFPLAGARGRTAQRAGSLANPPPHLAMEDTRVGKCFRRPPAWTRGAHVRPGPGTGRIKTIRWIGLVCPPDLPPLGLAHSAARGESSTRKPVAAEPCTAFGGSFRIAASSLANSSLGPPHPRGFGGRNRPDRRPCGAGAGGQVYRGAGLGRPRRGHVRQPETTTPWKSGDRLANWRR